MWSTIVAGIRIIQALLDLINEVRDLQLIAAILKADKRMIKREGALKKLKEAQTEEEFDAAQKELTDNLSRP
jgi:hypothetical protein